jgi:PAS domain S-box-containing protein
MVEERYRAIFAALREGVVVQYADGTVESVNAGAERILGLTAEQIADRSVRPAAWRIVRETGEPFPPDERPAEVALRTGRPRRDVVMGVHRPDGTLVWLSVNAEPFTDADGRPAGVVSSFFDISEMKQANAALTARADELTKTGEQLRSSNSELEAFSYMVSHDLRAPFRHISGYSELLLDSEQTRLSDKGKGYLRTIGDSAVQAGKLVDSLLTFAHLGRSAVQAGDVDMAAVVRDIIEELRHETRDRTISWRVQDDLPHAHADERMMRLVLRNLLGNAVKYSRPRQRAVIEVGGREDAKETVFWVKDNGVGFDMRYVEKLFGVFERLHSQEDFEGTGIGLAHVRRIVNRHGGRTWAEGKENEGATFYFSVPKGA